MGALQGTSLRRSGQHAWAARALATVWGLGLGASLALAQVPTAEDPVAGIEQWHGLRRVDRGAQPKPTGPLPRSAIKADAHAGPGLLDPAVTRAVGRDSDVGPGAEPVKPASFAPNAPSPAAVAPATPTGATPPPYFVIVNNEASRPAVEANPADHPPAASQDGAAPAAERPAAIDNTYFYNLALLQVLTTVGTLVLGPVVVVFSLLVFLRRWAATAGSGPVFRIEMINPQAPQVVVHTSGLGVAPPPEARPLSSAPAGPTAEEDEGEWTAQPFDLGPTYEEEMALKQESERLQQEALVRHIFEQNLKLQNELSRLEEESVEAAAPPPVAPDADRETIAPE